MGDLARRAAAYADALLLDVAIAVAHACCRLIGHDPIPTAPPYCRRCGDTLWPGTGLYLEETP